MQAENILTNKLPRKGPTSNRVILQIENIVATINIHIPIDLNHLLQLFHDVEKKDNFPGVITKFTKPKATLLIFSSGKIVMTGVRLENHIPLIVEKILKKFKLAGIHAEETPEVKIENMVGRADFKTKINLDISSLVLERAIYEPEVFPGLIYKVINPEKICFLIFNSGKVICTGANNLTTIKNAIKRLASKLKSNGLLGEEVLNPESEKTPADMLDLV